MACSQMVLQMGHIDLFFTMMKDKMSARFAREHSNSVGIEC